MGIAGGTEALSGIHKVFITRGDPAASLFAMRHTWRAYFDFGEFETELVRPDAVRFVVNGYSDVSAAHGMLIVGWHVSAARLSDSPKARAEVLAKPWKGDRRLSHQVFF